MLVFVEHPVRFEDMGSKHMLYFSKTFWRYKSIICLYLMVLFTALLTTSCATKTEIRSMDSVAVDSPGPTRAYSDSPHIEMRLRNEYRKWEGTEHSLGGSDYDGVDCSGFVKVIYKKIFDIEMPRTTRQQVKTGVPVGRNELRAGDLVFFKPPTFPRHVGIFLSGTEFVHASKSKGVTISQLDPEYWGRYYWTARRVLPDS